MEKRKLQLQGFYPMIYNYNGQLVQLSHNYTSETNFKQIPQAKRNQTPRSFPRALHIEEVNSNPPIKLTIDLNNDIKPRKKGNLKTSEEETYLAEMKSIETTAQTQNTTLDVETKYKSFYDKVSEYRKKNLKILSSATPKSVKRELVLPSSSKIISTTTKYISEVPIQSTTEFVAKTEQSSQYGSDIELSTSYSQIYSYDSTTIESIITSTTDNSNDKTTILNDDGTTTQSAQETDSTLEIEHFEFSTVYNSYETTTAETTLMTTEISDTDDSTTPTAITETPFEPSNEMFLTDDGFSTVDSGEFGTTTPFQPSDELYLADDGFNTVTPAKFSSIGQMSFFSDSSVDKFEDEYKMDQLALNSIERIKTLKRFNGNEKMVLRSIFRRKWKDIRKELKDLQKITNDGDPNVMHILDNSK